MPAFTQNGEIGKIYANLQDGTGEQEVSKVFVNKQDGNGEQLVWRNTIIIDDFEDSQPLSEWNISGTGTTDTSTSVSYHEATSMNMEVDGLTEADGDPSNLPAVPQPGDRWEFYIRFNTFQGGGQSRFYFGGTGDKQDCYVIHFYEDGTFRLEKDVGGSNTELAYDSVSVSTDVWYRIRHWWEHPDQSSDHVLELTNMDTDTQKSQQSVNDTEWNSGSVWLRMNAYVGGFWDWIRITDRTQ